MQPADLLHTAKVLLDASAGPAEQACLRRAVSSTYYALFHCLARDCADLFTNGNFPHDPAWRQAYRGLDHSTCKEQCRKLDKTRFPRSVQEFATAFVNLQDRRHQADYDPSVTFLRSDVEVDIAAVERIFLNYRKATTRERIGFCAHVMFKQRR